MKDGVMVLNCARGGIINQNDLYDAMQSGKVAGAALDVFETEPPGDLPLLQMDNVIATPHLGASTKEAQTNVAVAVAKQIIAYLKTGTIINAVNVSSVTGELLEKLSPYLKLADALGSIQAQLSQGPFEEIAIEYKGDFHGLDLSPVTTAIIKGFLTPLVMDDVNSVNAPIIARDMGIKVTETMTGESEDYTHLINVRVVSPKASNLVAGTIFGKNDPRIVRINKFRLELIVRKGFFVLINNYDKPGAIGSIGTVMGSNDINISRMQVGQEEGGNRTLIFIRVDQPIPEDVLESLRSLPMVISATPFEL
jgi:D-3-phosphoglycerate dehydrogenase